MHNDVGPSAAAPAVEVVEEDPGAPDEKEKSLGDDNPDPHAPTAPPAKDLDPEIAGAGHEEAPVVAEMRSTPLPVVVAIKKQTEASGAQIVKFKLISAPGDSVGHRHLSQFMSSIDPTSSDANSLGIYINEYASKNDARIYRYYHGRGQRLLGSPFPGDINIVFLFGSNVGAMNTLLDYYNQEGVDLYAVHPDDPNVLIPFSRGEPLAEANLLATMAASKEVDITTVERLLTAARLKMTGHPAHDKVAIGGSGVSAPSTGSTDAPRAAGGAGASSIFSGLGRFFGGGKDKSSTALPAKDAKDTPPDPKKPK
jgi:hypothetical protein